MKSLKLFLLGSFLLASFVSLGFGQAGNSTSRRQLTGTRWQPARERILPDGKIHRFDFLDAKGELIGAIQLAFTGGTIRGTVWKGGHAQIRLDNPMRDCELVVNGGFARNGQAFTFLELGNGPTIPRGETVRKTKEMSDIDESEVIIFSPNAQIVNCR